MKTREGDLEAAMNVHPRMATLVLTPLIAGMASAGAARAAEPIKLTVGYQPYDTISYSAAVMRAQELWKKYQPAGSELEFQIGLQGSIIVNQMLRC